MGKKREHVHEPVGILEFCSCGATRKDDGEWNTGKDPAAVALGSKAIAMSTAEERHARAVAGGAGRWGEKSNEEKSDYMSWMASQPRPSRRLKERCPCGRFSVTTAAKRKHVCGKALEDKRARQEARFRKAG